MYNVHIAEITDGKTKTGMIKQKQIVHRSEANTTKRERFIYMQRKRWRERNKRKIHIDIERQTHRLNTYFFPTKL